MNRCSISFAKSWVEDSLELNFKYIRESVDSLCRDGTDVQHMQYLILANAYGCVCLASTVQGFTQESKNRRVGWCDGAELLCVGEEVMCSMETLREYCLWESLYFNLWLGSSS